MERARGRFGLSLLPRETLETIIAFSGKYGQFRVRRLSGRDAGLQTRRRASKRTRRKGGKRH
jgi:hypothetical protein